MSNGALPLARSIPALAGGRQNFHLPIRDAPPHHHTSLSDVQRRPLIDAFHPSASGRTAKFPPSYSGHTTTHHQVMSNGALPLARSIPALAGGRQNFHLPIRDAPPHHHTSLSDVQRRPPIGAFHPSASGRTAKFVPSYSGHTTTHHQLTSNDALPLLARSIPALACGLQNLQRQDVHVVPRRQ